MGALFVWCGFKGVLRSTGGNSGVRGFEEWG